MNLNKPDATIARLKEKRFDKRRTRQSQPSQTTNASSTSQILGAHQVGERTSAKNQRYVPASVKHAVWQRDHGQCCMCGSRQNLQYDHIRPGGLGGSAAIENLRLLCFSCNQRAAMRVYGVGQMKTAVEKSRRCVRE